MNEITVTMPMRKYKEMEQEIKELKKKHISNYTSQDWSNVKKGAEKPEDVVIIFDQQKAIEDIAAINPAVQTINVKTAEGLLLKPIKVNGDTNE